MATILTTKEALDAAGQPFATRDYWGHIEKLLEYHRTTGREALVEAVWTALDDAATTVAVPKRWAEAVVAALLENKQSPDMAAGLSMRTD